MKIIKHGNVPKATATCPVCGCEFEYEPKDVYEGTADAWGLAKTYVACPECDTRIECAIPTNQ